MNNSGKNRLIYRYFLFLALSGFTAWILSSCVSSTSYIKSAYISGSAQKSLIRITENTEKEELTLRCQFSQNLQQEIHTSATEVNSITSGDDVPLNIDLINNVHWQLPQSELFFDLEFPLSQTVVVFGGLNLGKVDRKTSVGKSIGLGLRREHENVGVRMDISYNIQDMNYEVMYVNQTEFLWGDVEEQVIYDQGTLTSKNLGMGITLNAAVKEWLVNPFIHGGFGSQTIIDPEETSFIPDPPSYSDSYLNLTFGLFFHFGHSHRLIIGYGMNKHSNEGGKAPWISDLILQADIVF